MFGQDTAGDVQALIRAGRFEEISPYLLSILDRAAALDAEAAAALGQAEIDAFMLALSFAFLCDDYAPSEIGEVLRLLERNPAIAALAGLSSLKTTDAVLGPLLGRRNNLIKALVLYSAANAIRIDPALLFQANPQLASVWFFLYPGDDYAGFIDPASVANLRRHFPEIERCSILPVDQAPHLYYSVTYIDEASERRVKSKINALVRERFAESAKALPSRPAPNPERVAVISGCWSARHSVYRTNFKFVESLKGSKRLILVDCSPGGNGEASLFDEVIRWTQLDDFTPLAGLDAMVAFFPDMGMTLASLIAGNQRLAPIQIMGCGHPVSAFGSEIDWYLSGRDVEDDESIRRNYSERVILIPGRGVVANSIPLPRSAPPEDESGPIRVLLPWAAQKINAESVGLLKRVVERAGRDIEFHVFIGNGLGGLGHRLFSQRLQTQLSPARVVVHAAMAPSAYFSWVARMHVAADSWPYGGFNTIVDCLHFGVPVIAYEHSRAFSRFGPHLMRGLGLGALVATDHDGFVEALARLVSDAAWRRDWRETINALDLDATVYAESNGDSFRVAVDRLIAAGPRAADGERSPLII